MIQSIASLVVQKPLNILLVGVVFGVAYLVLRFTSFGVGKHPSALLVPVLGWLLCAKSIRLQPPVPQKMEPRR